MAKHNIPVDPDKGSTRAVDVILDATSEADFDVTPEKVPSGLLATYDGKDITWFSNFSVTKKSGKSKTGKKVKYYIELDTVPGNLVYYDASSKSAIPLTTRSAGNNRIQADLSVDDPPIGHT